MECIIKPYDNIKKINILKSCCYTNSDFNQYIIKNGDTPLICQTPWLYLNSTPRYIIKNIKKIYFLTLLFWNINHDKHQHQWVQFLNIFQKTSSRWINRKKRNIKWMNCLEQNKNNYLWKLSDILNNVKCFDFSKKNADVKNIQHQDYVRLVIHFSHIWHNTKTDTAGFSFKILQIQYNKVEPPIEIMFSDIKSFPTTNNHVLSDEKQIKPNVYSSHNEHPVFGKYFKMLQVGIPIFAIKQKMTMNNLDPSIIDIPDNQPLPNVNENIDDQLQASLKEEKTLRKTEPIVKMKQVSSGKSHGISLQQILNGLNSLRKSTFGKKKCKKKEIKNNNTKNDVSSSGNISSSRNELLLDLLKNKYNSM